MSPAKSGLIGNRMYKGAIQQFKNTPFTNVGRALTKHPEVVGLTKSNLRNIHRTVPEVNLAASKDYAK